MKKMMILSMVLILILSTLSGCTNEYNKVSTSKSPTRPDEHRDFTFAVNPETFDLTIVRDGIKEQAAIPLPASKVLDLKQEEDKVEWTYPERKVKVLIEKKPSYLDITIQSTGAEQFQWPEVSANSYMLPLWEGKYIPSQDANWRAFLKDETFSWSESFSMNVFALNKADYSLVYILKNAFNNQVGFDTKAGIQLQFSHEFPAINPDKTYGFRLYVSNNDPVQIAGLYKKVVEENSAVITLAEKAKANPQIKKLYGAPHIYLWNNNLITAEDLNWVKWKADLNSPFNSWVSQLLEQHSEDGAKEFSHILKTVSNQDYVDNYQKSVIVNVLNQVLTMRQLYKASVFEHTDASAQKLINEGIANLSEQKLYQLNTMLVKSVLKDEIREIDQWGKENSTDIIKEMKQLGIKKAWIGLPNWTNGLMKPEFVEQATQAGYLIAPYDSYHSIQETENKDWNTAYFDDAALYKQATIETITGEKVKGFLGVGRKLNPTLSLPSVKKRVQGILQDDISYNSWFVDADATGEFYDDYSPQHPTTQQQDMNARLARMAYIANEKKMVVGSETGNDFSSSSIAFAHGLETPVIKWSDPDMRTNKTSEYYIGGYYSAQGGIPERYSKQVPIKELYKHIYMDPTYSLPLYKLVYNDTVITTHHWEWGSFKIKDSIVERMMNEFLYNIPPLYHLNQQEWAKDKKLIVAYLKQWAPFHEKAVTQPMTDFRVLTKDRLVQSTNFGDEMKVIANFSPVNFQDDRGTIIKPQTVVVYKGSSFEVVDFAAMLK